MKYIIIFLTILIPVLACGPYFASSILPGNRKFKVMPLADFRAELNQINSNKVKFKKLKNIDKRGDLEKEFLAAAKHYKLNDPEKALKDFLSVRKRIERYRKENKNNVSDKQIKFPKIIIPNTLPKEYQLYLDGAINHYEGLESIALKRWSQLLKLPKEQRLYRTVWARYMIADVNMGTTDIDQYLSQNELLRKDVENGFKDIQGLGVSTYGNEGYFFFHTQQNYLNAIKSYHLHFIHGGKGALESLKFSIRRFFRNPNQQLKEAVRDPLIRNIVTRYLISSYSDSGDSNARENWLLTLEEEGIKDVELIDRLAWIAYRSGNWKLTVRYLNLSKSESIIKNWLSSRIAFRNGLNEKAFNYLKSVSELLKNDKAFLNYDLFENEYQHYLNPQENFNKFNTGEMALFHLEKGQLKQSLKLFFQSNYWDDAAYLAERLMTANELKIFIAENEDYLSSNKKLFSSLNHLLARKLSRQGRWKEALPYFTEKLKLKTKEIYLNIEKGKNLKLSNEERAEAYWRAAVLTRSDGIDILGTELTPDFKCVDGQFEFEPIGKRRIELAKKGDLTECSEKELKRIKFSPSSPMKRFHYRYIAADIAWEAIKLMPANENDTAKKIIIAGNWIQARSPKDADRFYKELVRKCGKTELGKEADRIRWFPELLKTETP